jgi:hypothetical protein
MGFKLVAGFQLTGLREFVSKFGGLPGVEFKFQV